MCTVSVVATRDRLRVMCNRDERHGRPEAWHPRAEATGTGFAVMPVDAPSGGTWIAASSHGLVFAVLNGDGPVPPEAPSRGHLIPRLIESRTIAEVIERAEGLCGTRWPPHRLVVASRMRVVDLRVRARGLGLTELSLTAPVMATSSSFEADAVVPERRRLFTAHVLGSPDVLAAQDAFHRHRWAGRGWASVDMRRHDAATHSITTVDVSADRIAMRYEPRRHPAGEPGWITVPRAIPAARLSKVS